MMDLNLIITVAYFRNNGLERSKSFAKDIEWLGQLNLCLHARSMSSIYLEELAAQSPPLFFCHLYNIYFSHITGGQVIARKVRGGGGSLVIEFITHKHQSSSAMSSTIFPSLTTFFSRGGHHSSPHPTISPQPTNTLTKQNINA
ncbi:putative Heme oxygenase (biliverdin-producing) [Helianthus anomalus]